MSAAPAPPFHAETIGSLLRPRAMKDAHRAFVEQRLPRAEYEATVDAEVGRVIARQEALGFRAVSDGELTRSSWFGFFFEAMDGFRLEPSQFRFRDAEGGAFEWPTCVAEKPIVRRGGITLPEFRRVARLAKALPKASMPTPSAFHFFRLAGAVDPAAYPEMDRFFDDLVAVYRAELHDLAAAGCRYVQFDEVPLAMLCDPLVQEQARAQGGAPEALLDTYVGLLQRILAGRPAGLTVGLHLCRGNFRGRWMASGGYEPIAAKLFNAIPVDVFFLEYDSGRAGDFAPLRHVPASRSVVLGLVSTKIAALEPVDDLRRRLDDAARHVPLERLGLSPQCGFASVAGGNLLSEDEQWAKLARIADTARQVWGTT
jgi:5-methyltetrahydropteroyltriglutamate--homocysteine methyltransferase